MLVASDAREHVEVALTATAIVCAHLAGSSGESSRQHQETVWALVLVEPSLRARERTPDATELVMQGSPRAPQSVGVHEQAASPPLWVHGRAHIGQTVRGCGVSDEAAERITGLKKDPMAKSAEELLTRTGWLPSLLRTRTPTTG